MWKTIVGSIGITSVVFSAIVGFLIWILEKKMEKRENIRAKKEEDHNKFLLAMLKGTSASMALSEAIAKAVQRIPDAHCNGDMHEALNYEQTIKHELKDFMFEQGVQNINE